MNKLIKDIGNYLDNFYKSFPLSNRIVISHKKEMSSIKPSVSFILIPDEKFKAKIKLTEFAEKNKALF